MSQKTMRTKIPVISLTKYVSILQDDLLENKPSNTKQENDCHYFLSLFIEYMCICTCKFKLTFSILIIRTKPSF